MLRVERNLIISESFNICNPMQGRQQHHYQSPAATTHLPLWRVTAQSSSPGAHVREHGAAKLRQRGLPRHLVKELDRTRNVGALIIAKIVVSVWGCVCIAKVVVFQKE